MLLRGSFEFTDLNAIKARQAIDSYPERRSAVMPLLHIAQEQNGWLSDDVLAYVAGFLDIPLIFVYEVASFYTMYNREPVGKHLIEVCRTTPCWLCDSESVLLTCTAILGIHINQTTKDGNFTLREVECLGACRSAPIMVVDGVYHEKVTIKKCEEILNSLLAECDAEAASIRAEEERRIELATDMMIG